MYKRQPLNIEFNLTMSLFKFAPSNVMVTLLGDTFASRVGASLLAAVGLPECIARSSAEYLQLCMDLCGQPGRLQELRQRLGANRGTAPLFDMKQFTRDLEDLYFRMQEGDFALAEAAVAKG